MAGAEHGQREKHLCSRRNSLVCEPIHFLSIVAMNNSPKSFVTEGDRRVIDGLPIALDQVVQPSGRVTHAVAGAHEKIAQIVPLADWEREAYERNGNAD